MQKIASIFGLILAFVMLKACDIESTIKYTSGDSKPSANRSNNTNSRSKGTGGGSKPLASRCDDIKNVPKKYPSVSPMQPPVSRFEEQWNLQEFSSANPGGINMPKAWGITTGKPEINIAFIDQEFDFKKPYIAACPDRFLPIGLPFTNVGLTPGYALHGTRGIAIAGRCTQAGQEFAGINWFSKMHAIDPGWLLNFEAVTENLLKDKYDIVNASIGYVLKEEEFATSTIKNLVLAMGKFNREGGVLVAGVGNDTRLMKNDFPGSFPGVITVGGSTKSAQAYPKSSWGKHVAIMAPGENVPHTPSKSITGESDRYSVGNSFAAPAVTGVISLMLSVFPNPAQFHWKIARHILMKTAQLWTCDQYCPSTYGPAQAKCKNDCCVGDKNTCSAGLLNAAGAVEEARQGIPMAALLDVDTYYVEVPLNGSTIALGLKNHGNKSTFAKAKVTNIGGDTVLTNLVVEIENLSICGADSRNSSLNIKIKNNGAKVNDLFKVTITSDAFSEDNPLSDYTFFFVKVI